MLLKLLHAQDPLVRLSRVDQTDSGRTWIFTFTDPAHRFMQSFVVAKDLPDVALAVEAAYEKIWASWRDRIRQGQWEQGLEKMKHARN